MKVGDIVKKHTGRDEGKIGIVLDIIANDANNIIVTVLSDGNVHHWYSKYVGAAWDVKKDKCQR